MVIHFLNKLLPSNNETNTKKGNLNVKRGKKSKNTLYTFITTNTNKVQSNKYDDKINNKKTNEVRKLLEKWMLQKL